MNLIHKLILLLLFFFSLPVLIAQSDFRAGYIITNEGDTIHGLIDYRGDSRNSKKCSFRENDNSAVKEFKPDDILGYRFTDSKYYVSKNVKFNGTETRQFLEFLVNGIADLYYYRDDNLSRYLIEKEDGKLFELTNDEVEIKKNGTTYLKKTNRYIGSLRYAFADCPQLFQSIDNSKLESKSLIGITKKYHDYTCDGEKCIIYEKQLPVIRLRFAPFVSLNSSALRFGNSDHFYRVIKFQTTSYPAVGLLMNTSMPRANERFSFQLSAEVGKSYFYGNGDYAPSNTSHEVRLYNTAIKGKAGIKYAFGKGKFRPTIMAGLQISDLIKKEGTRIEDRNENGSIHTTEYNDDILAKTQLGYNLDLGIDYHISSAIVPFLSIGYSSSTGDNRKVNIVYLDNYTMPLTTNIKTININAGIYF